MVINEGEHLRPRKNDEAADVSRELRRTQEALAEERKGKAKLAAELEAVQADRATGMAVDAGGDSDRGDVREDISKLRRAMASNEENIENSAGSVKDILVAALEQQKIELLRLQGKQVEGRSIAENLRITEANISRRERALGRIKEDGLELQDRIVDLHAKMAKLQADFTIKSDELVRDKADKARLLARQASEAAASLPPAAPVQHAVAAAVPPTAEVLFNSVASLPGFCDQHLQVLRGLWEALQLQAQPVPAAAVRVPTSPVLEPAATPVLAAPPPAGEGTAPAADTLAAADLPAHGEPAGTEPTPPAGQPTPQGPAPMLVGDSEAEGVTDSQGEAAAQAATAAGTWMAALDEERAAKKGRNKF